MNEEQKDRLEKELKFLSESLEADVITKDEFEKGKERIEKKLSELDEQKTEEVPTSEPEESKIEIKEIKQETKIIGGEDIKEEEKPEEETDFWSKKDEDQLEEKKEDPDDEVEDEEPEKKDDIPKEDEEETVDVKVSRKWVYAAVLLVAVIIVFSMRGCSDPTEEVLIEEVVPDCFSDVDCEKEGYIGNCLNPDTEEATCEFKEDARTFLTIIDDDECRLCSTSTMKNIIKELFPNVQIIESDYKEIEARGLVDKLGIDVLPAYVFDSNVSKAIRFDDFKNALVKNGENYVVRNTVAGNYYFKRPLVTNKLNLYATEGNVDVHVQQVLGLFGDKIEFTKQIVTEKQKENLKKQLGITTYPTFLVNNQVKFIGVLPADMIKEKICDVAYFQECEKELSKNI
ncbi:MAG: hypothetical protein U9O94_03900 [Nanoarchaeota archaeon]|nr:hypothetical protein [Nanoarchaeota archaeon]